MEYLILTVLIIAVACMLSGKPIKIQIEYKQPDVKIIDVEDENEKQTKELEKVQNNILKDVAEVFKEVVAYDE